MRWRHTPFEHRPYGLELGLCQRYYFPIWNGAVDGRALTFIGHGGGPQNSNYFGMAIQPNVEMRAVPSIHQANTVNYVSNVINWPSGGNLGNINTNFSIWGTGTTKSVTLLTTTTGPSGNNQPVYAGVSGFYDATATNTMLALTAEL